MQPGHLVFLITGPIRYFISTIRRQQLIAQQHYDYMEKLKAGELSTVSQKQKLLAVYAEELSDRRRRWDNLRVSVVAGAGFEPAAFRL